MSRPSTPIFDRWLAVSARAREAEHQLSMQQVACMREGGTPPSVEQMDALTHLRAESAHLLAQAIEEVRILAQTLRAPQQPRTVDEAGEQLASRTPPVA